MEFLLTTYTSLTFYLIFTFDSAEDGAHSLTDMILDTLPLSHSPTPTLRWSVAGLCISEGEANSTRAVNQLGATGGCGEDGWTVEVGGSKSPCSGEAL